MSSPHFCPNCVNFFILNFDLFPPQSMSPYQSKQYFALFKVDNNINSLILLTARKMFQVENSKFHNFLFVNPI